MNVSHLQPREHPSQARHTKTIPITDNISSPHGTSSITCTNPLASSSLPWAPLRKRLQPSACTELLVICTSLEDYYCWWYPLKGKGGCEDMAASSTWNKISRARKGWGMSFSRLGLRLLTGSSPCTNLSQSPLQHTGLKDGDAAWESVQMCLDKTACPRRI